MNGVVLTATSGAIQLLPLAFSKWLPLFNEIANVAATATGRNWLYSGTRKRVIDGIALGGIAGQALHAGGEHGALAGALTFGVSVGLTYWFPNKYFHSIMRGIPKKLPEPLRKAGASPVGQGVIGISMIVVLEQILEHAQHLAQILPKLLGAKAVPGRAVANNDDTANQEIPVRHALALFIFDSVIPSNANSLERTKLVLYLAGIDLQGHFFSDRPAPLAVKTISRPVHAALHDKLEGEVMRGLLSEDERRDIEARMNVVDR